MTEVDLEKISQKVYKDNKNEHGEERFWENTDDRNTSIEIFRLRTKSRERQPDTGVHRLWHIQGLTNGCTIDEPVDAQ